MNHLTNLLVKTSIPKKDVDYHLIRASLASTVDTAIIN